MRYQQLNPAMGVKPLDFGAGGITVSINPKGRLIALNAYHPLYGYMGISSALPFPENDRYKAEAVRAYRKSLLSLEGIGLDFGVQISKMEAFLLADAIPQLRLSFDNGASATVTSFMPLGFSQSLLQIWEFSDESLAASLNGKFWIQRSAYTQITEGGPVVMPSTMTKIAQDKPLLVENSAMDAWALLSGGAKELEDGSIELQGTIPNEKVLLFGIGLSEKELVDEARLLQLQNANAHQLLQASIDIWEKRWEGIPDDPILRRGLSYALACCVPNEDEATCFLTDHMLLALSWNRDAYYAALALLHWKQAEATEQVRRHLIWSFEKAERTEGHFWGRSYLANGKIKDYGYQLDQQLFPLLELADYYRLTGDKALLSRLQKYIEPLLQALLARKSSTSGLFPTDETPADDPIAYPYHFSSHLLFWYLLKRLPEILPNKPSLKAFADEIAESIQKHFVTDWKGRAIYAYATDGEGKHHFYHDANDLPVALAPSWGFCSADEAVWRATIDFAFSPDNEGGYYEGRLGSVHSRAAWPLGDIQDFIIARSLGNVERSQNALQHIEQAAQWDGALPEAYDARTGEVVTRHWFVWPNAAYACTILGAFQRE